jgi:signal transduction histidine kinase
VTEIAAGRQATASRLDARTSARLRAALAALLGLLGVVAGVAAVAVVLSSNHARSRETTALLLLLTGWSFIGCGLFAWLRRPENRIGLLMVGVGFVSFLAALGEANASMPFTVGIVFANAALALFAHLLLAFPTGRLETRFRRAAAIALYIDLVGLQVLWLLFADVREVGCGDCVAGGLHEPAALSENGLLVWRNAGAAGAIDTAQNGFGIALGLAVAALLLHRWRSAAPPARRALAPVLLSGAVAVVVLLVALATYVAWDVSAQPLRWLALATYPLVPFAFLIGILRVRLARSAVGSLVIELGETPAPGRLRDLLSRALGDPSLELAYHVGDHKLVDVDGHAVELPAEGTDRAATTVEHDGQPVAALVHDASLLEEPELLDAVTAATGLALANERLQAELRARLEDLRRQDEEVRRSRARIVEAGDAARRRLERNLHDGAQQRLVALALTLRMAESRATEDPEGTREIIKAAGADLAEALSELRELARGIHPALLTERGLGEAVEVLGRRAAVPIEVAAMPDRRLPEPIEAASYYLIAESLTNAARHAQATKVVVSVRCVAGRAMVEVRDDGVGGADDGTGSGLSGLRDRVEALDGSLEVVSPPGGGTTIRADLPCDA